MAARAGVRVAVLTLTRDRLDYTKHCFARLKKLAGIRYDHYVLDQGSQDGTPDWVAHEYRPCAHILSPVNLGISTGLNLLLEQAVPAGYDVIVKFDNDCELVTRGSLRDCAVLVHHHPEWLLSPNILGLNSPMPIGSETVLDGHRVGLPPMIGGIFLAANARLFDTYRHDEGNPIWGMDDVALCKHVQRHGGQVGYLLNHQANHYETTNGQQQRYPDYFHRKAVEMA